VQKIDGETFLMLKQDDIINTLKVLLGPAIKISNAILQLKERQLEIDLLEFKSTLYH